MARSVDLSLVPLVSGLRPPVVVLLATLLMLVDEAVRLGMDDCELVLRPFSSSRDNDALTPAPVGDIPPLASFLLLFPPKDFLPSTLMATLGLPGGSPPVAPSG